MSDLQSAYTLTEYLLISPQITIRINHYTPELDRFLFEKGISTYAIISAENPGSVLLSPERNRILTQSFHKIVIMTFEVFINAVNVDPQAKWPVENSYFIANISEAESSVLGCSFKQNAIVFGKRGTKAQLIWLQSLNQK